MKRTGYWVFETHVVDDMNFSDTVSDTPDMSEPTTINTQRVYIPVTVDTSGEKAVAYYHQRDVSESVNLDRLRKRDGRVYVPMEQVWPSRPKEAEPYQHYKD